LIYQGFKFIQQTLNINLIVHSTNVLFHLLSVVDIGYQLNENLQILMCKDQTKNTLECGKCFDKVLYGIK